MTLMNTSGQPELALVTGAGQGIGAATARMLIEQGMRVIAVDKQPELLTALSDDFGDLKVSHLHQFLLWPLEYLPQSVLEVSFFCFISFSTPSILLISHSLSESSTE